MIPFRIHQQKTQDECTSCALAAIAEDILQKPVDPDYIYQNSRDYGEYGILPERAVEAVVSKGVRLETGEIIYPYRSSWKVWSWFNWFGTLVNILPRGSLFCGCYWQSEWERAENGVVFLPPLWQKMAPHAFKVFGTVERDGIMYLKIQNSRGIESGDNGIWYFPKEVVNKFSFAYQLYEKN